MKKLPSFAVYALMAPAIAFGIGSAFAADPPAEPAGAKEQRTTQEQGHMMPEQAKKEMGMATADRAQEQRMAQERAKQREQVHATYLSSAPANSFGSGKLIGANLKTRSGDETIGPVTDLVIDENGQIAAVIVEVGGFLGLGEKNVAISWDSIERRSNQKDADTNFRVDTTKEALENAPEYKAEAKKY